MTQSLTLREAQVLNFMREFLRREQRIPMNREIAKKLGLKSENSGRLLVKELERKGHLVRGDDKRIKLLKP